MTTRYYSRRTVEKLKAQLHCAESNFNSTLADNEKLGQEITELKKELQRTKENLSLSRDKVGDLEIKLGIRTSYTDGCNTVKAQVKACAARRAHEELHKVKPTETSAQLLHRAIGNAQGHWQRAGHTGRGAGRQRRRGRHGCAAYQPLPRRRAQGAREKPHVPGAGRVLSHDRRYEKRGGGRMKAYVPNSKRASVKGKYAVIIDGRHQIIAHASGEPLKGRVLESDAPPYTGYVRNWFKKEKKA